MPRVIGTVFGLNDVYTKQALNATTVTDDYWPTDADYGVMMEGGIDSSFNGGSDVYRWDFSTDTVSDIANAPIAAGVRACISDTKQRFGWFVGGLTGPSSAHSQSVRMDLTSDVLSVPQNWPTTIKWGAGGASWQANAYVVAGGTSPGLAHGSLVDKFDYSTETISPVANFPLLRGILASVWDRDYGFFACGQNAWFPFTTQYSNTTKLEFSTDTFSASSNYGTNNSSQQSASHTEHYGFFAGGQVSAAAISSTYKFDFKSEVYSASTNLPAIKRMSTATGDRKYGYLNGGGGPGFGPNVTLTVYSNTNKFDYSSETYSALGNTSDVWGGGGAVAGGGAQRIPEFNNSGLIAGGYSAGGAVSDIVRNDYSVDTWTTTNGKLTASIYAFGNACGNANIYFAGGYTAPGQRSTIDRLDCNTELVNATSMTLNEAIYDSVGTNNKTSYYGYFIGGWTGGPGNYRSYVRRIDMNTETTSNPINFPVGITQFKLSEAAPASESYQIVSEETGTGTSYIRKLDWVTENVTLLPTRFPVTRFNMRMVQNQEYIWVVPGPYFGTPESRTWRWDWVAETATVQGPIGAVKRLPHVTSSHYDGYITGGIFVPSTTRKFNFSTETPSAGTSFPVDRGDADGAENI